MNGVIDLKYYSIDVLDAFLPRPMDDEKEMLYCKASEAQSQQSMNALLWGFVRNNANSLCLRVGGSSAILMDTCT